MFHSFRSKSYVFFKIKVPKFLDNMSLHHGVSYNEIIIIISK